VSKALQDVDRMAAVDSPEVLKAACVGIACGTVSQTSPPGQRTRQVCDCNRVVVEVLEDPDAAG
jgi:hypothetical protein